MYKVLRIVRAYSLENDSLQYDLLSVRYLNEFTIIVTYLTSPVFFQPTKVRYKLGKSSQNIFTGLVRQKLLNHFLHHFSVPNFSKLIITWTSNLMLHPMGKIIIRVRRVTRHERGDWDLLSHSIGQIAIFLSLIIITDNWLWLCGTSWLGVGHRRLRVVESSLVHVAEIQARACVSRR